jgi:molecular chaperone GrpE
MASDSEAGKNDGANGAADAGNGAAPDAKPASTPPEAAAAPSELDSLRAERDKLRDQMLRTSADFENFRKRAKRDLDDARAHSKHELIRDLLPVFDYLELATKSGSASDVKSVIEGVKMVLKLFEDTAERVGLKRVPATGERFDPAVHDAIQQKETDEHPPGTVIAEVSPGYRFGDRLVRAARVIVARKPAEAPRVSERPKSAQASSGDGATSAANPDDKSTDTGAGNTDKTE